MKGVDQYEMKGKENTDLSDRVFLEGIYYGFNGAAQKFNCRFGESEWEYQFCTAQK